MNRNYRKWVRAAAYFPCVGLLTACGAIPHYSDNAVINVPVSLETEKVRRAALPALPPNIICEEKNWECRSPLFIGIAVSGGGLRAANFGLGALAQLSNLGFIDEVSAFSAVSGGSLVTAAYVLHPFHSEEEFQQLATKLRTDFLSAWIVASLSPTRIVPTLFTAENATHTLADVFDDKIFLGATFGNLDSKGNGRSKLYINASLVNHVDPTRGLTTRANNASTNSLQGFTFSATAFDAMHSDLSKIRLAEAVAASGAYPGVFEPLALKDFAYFPNTREQRQPSFLHLIDGGVSDNLGIDALVTAYANQMRHNPQSSCLLIFMDAHVSDQGDMRGYMPDLRTSPMDYVVSGSLSRSFDLLLDRRREDQLNAFGISISEADPARFKEDVLIPLGNEKFSSNGMSSVKSGMRDHGFSMAIPGGEFYTHANCAIWHVPLDGLLNLTEMKGRTNRQIRFPYHLDSDESPRDQGLKKLDYFVNAVETNYKLKMNGGGQCSAMQIQAALFEAAYQLMRADTKTLSALKEWLKKRQRPDIAAMVARQIDDQNMRMEVLVPPYDVYPASIANPLADWVKCNDEKSPPNLGEVQ